MAAEPKLSGALLAMIAAAALLALGGLAGFLFAFDRLSAIGARYLIAVGFVTAWSGVFVVMTLARARATPLVASAGLALWVGYRSCVVVFTGEWALLIDLLGEVILLAGFCGYMTSGSLPAAYYRRQPNA